MLLDSMDDISEVLGRCLAQNGLVLGEEELAAQFFDLNSRIAGELFQKIVNYHSRLAIVLQEPDRYGKRFSELVYEHRNHPAIRFFQKRSEAQRWLTGAE